MSNQPHNLLLPEKKRTQRMAYYVRVGGVCAVFGVLAVWFGIVSLAPAYFLVSGSLTETNAEIQAHTTGGEEEGLVEESVRAVRNLMALLEPHIKQSLLTERLSSVFADQSASIRIVGVVYDRAQHTLTMEGNATTRADLVAYVAQLEKLEQVERVVLPISDLARNTDLTFKIMVSFQVEQ